MEVWECRVVDVISFLTFSRYYHTASQVLVTLCFIVYLAADLL